VAVWKPSKRNEPDMTATLGSPITDVSWSNGSGRLAVAAENGKVLAFDTDVSL
jgi:hypothetical protein